MRLVTWNGFRSKLGRAVLVAGGIILAQVVLYGPSLIGKSVLLPLDILGLPGAYLPTNQETLRMVPQDWGLSDLVYMFEPARQFAVSELRAGRLPIWTTYQYAGSPSIWPKFSPFLLLESCFASPVVIAWAQLASALVAGAGAYLFFRRALKLRFWAASVAAWCYPLTGFLVLWQGFPTCGAVLWLPWLLLAVERTILSPQPLALAGLATVTGLVFVTGHVDVATQVLLLASAYAGWCLVDAWWRKQLRVSVGWSCAGLVAGFALGGLLASPYLLPLTEYARTSARLERRSKGEEERPPIGLAALPLVVMPDTYGATQHGTVPLFPKGQGSLQESSAGAYAGILGALVLAPLAWCSRRHRSVTWFWLLAGFFGLSWCLDVPGVVSVLRLPNLNIMSHNRWVFATAFATLALTAIGLDVLLAREVKWQPWFRFPAFLLGAVAVWSFYRGIVPAEPLATQVDSLLQNGDHFGWIHTADDLRQAQVWFSRTHIRVAVLCAAGLAGWAVLWLRSGWQRKMVPCLSLFLVGDLVSFAYGRNPQCSAALYYPRIPALEQLKTAPGRVIGFQCLPATLAETVGLRDVRGYDGIDPAPVVELLDMTADPAAQTLRLSHAVTQWLVPRTEMEPPDGVKLPPILDMLGVRYVIFRGTPPSGIRPLVESPDYYVLLNRSALPRVYVPGHVEILSNKTERLARLNSLEFDPSTVAYVESPITLPSVCRGAARILNETSVHVAVSVHMDTAGLVVLADLWEQGWRARLNGEPATILRTNHALRGVVAPPGEGLLEFDYQPDSLKRGFRLSVAAAASVVFALALSLCQRRSIRKS